MEKTLERTRTKGADYDAVVIGAGFGGLYSVYKLRNEQGLNVMAFDSCLLYTSPSPRDVEESRMPSSA